MTDKPITDLRRRMLEDMAVRRMGPKTTSDYIKHVEAFTRFLGRAPDTATGEVDFRYTGDVCIMLFMDGHVTTEAKWTDLNELERGRQIRVRGLDQR